MTIRVCGGKSHFSMSRGRSSRGPEVASVRQFAVNGSAAYLPSPIASWNRIPRSRSLLMQSAWLSRWQAPTDFGQRCNSQHRNRGRLRRREPYEEGRSSIGSRLPECDRRSRSRSVRKPASFLDHRVVNHCVDVAAIASSVRRSAFCESRTGNVGARCMRMPARSSEVRSCSSICGHCEILPPQSSLLHLTAAVG